MASLINREPNWAVQQMMEGFNHVLSALPSGELKHNLTIMIKADLEKFVADDEGRKEDVAALRSVRNGAAAEVLKILTKGKTAGAEVTSVPEFEQGGYCDVNGKWHILASIELRGTDVNRYNVDFVLGPDNRVSISCEADIPVEPRADASDKT